MTRFASAVIDRITGRVPNDPVALGARALTAADGPEGRDAFEGGDRPYFPPGRPLRPVAPKGSTTGRRWDYPSFINLTYAPRAEPGENAIGFKTLRVLADPAEGGLDVLRLAIETRKDQFAAQKWAIRGRARGDNGGKTARQVEEWLRRPDGINPFGVWVRMVLEDHYVLDAPTIFCSTHGGRPLFEVVDGATMKLVIDTAGRRPQPPLPAFQQVIKGTPAEFYTADEVGYYPYNLRPNKLYGMGRVEQVLTTVNIALNRQLSQLSFYTQGTLPDALISLPKEWTMEQIDDYQKWFDALLTGDVAERRKAFFIPDGAKPVFTKEPALKEEIDEWIVRVICYCFSLPPTAFVRQMNRATAENAKQQAQEEGLEPDKLWFKDVMDDLLQRMGQPGLEWYWEDEEIVDPQVKATVAVSLYGGAAGTSKPIMTLAEVREMMNLSPATAEQLLELQPPAPEPEPGDDGGNGNGNGNGNGDGTPLRVVKAAGSNGRGRSLRSLEPSARIRKAVSEAIGATARTAFRAQLDALHQALGAAHVGKATGSEPVTDETLEQLRKALEAFSWDAAGQEALRSALADMAADQSTAAIEQLRDYLPGGDDEIATLLRQANEESVRWAETRVGNLVTGVSETTQHAINQLVADAIRDGETNEELARTLSDVFQFSDDRALLIARTETAKAETMGALIGYRASGVVEQKEWLASPDACDDCAELDGQIVAVDDVFSNGEDGPPDHPNCVCVLLPVVGTAATAATTS